MDMIANFGSKVFDDKVMRQRLPKRVYDSLKHTNREGTPLDPAIAEVVAGSMKDWAVENGATHYTHWFQPMTNITAGKHDSFLTPAGDGSVILEFSGKSLVVGEPDASSFPNGGLRNTFEARGYTAWDPTSPAFIRDHTLYIPTAFCAYTGEALDMKTPLLRSMQALSTEALRVLRLFGNNTSHRVIPTVGAEQEYFLVDRKLYEQRLDLKICGRTLFGAKPPKGQELDDHYCGRIRLRVAEFMETLDQELWSLGVTAKTKHNEAAPAQHELAPVFESANIACDHNHLTMEMMRLTAKKLGLACLLHEKPFAGVNGSGKHNNWSLSTDDGLNLLDPGKTPWENVQFLTFLCAVITAVHDYSDLLRLSATSAGNDRRLGGYEAPPAIISVFLGEQLTHTLTDIACGKHVDVPATVSLQMGVETLPNLKRDDSDRNRTSPFAFTGNKFEFRMVGSSQSIALANVMLNTAVADVLHDYADRLAQSDDFDTELKAIISETVRDHSAVIFNGNNYTAEWVEEAKRRGLPNLANTVDAIEAMIDCKNINLFERTGVFSELECRSRYDIMLENYCKVVCIEASTMLEMAKRQIFPACIKYTGDTAASYNAMTAAGLSAAAVQNYLAELNELLAQIQANIIALEQAYSTAQGITAHKPHAAAMRDHVLPAMDALRTSCDKMETIMGCQYWPMPTYTDLLHRV
ncbi:glutamine synthetase III [Hydrogenoanaerobacterium sp.]|uniref:glutamine synthetase III family protein n=1 Tax=Hydrogenoanaerobacterium sp. TaxID=2953763 RepID=UPI00289D1D33|nr:glutamine synthetase III [Hydrogenoanaerobacterium sp.]